MSRNIGRTGPSNEESVTRQYEHFLANHSDKKVSPQNFRRVMRACFPDLDTEKLESHFFRMCDTNADGHIDFPEFMEFMIVLHQMSNGNLYSQKGRVHLYDQMSIINFGFGQNFCSILDGFY